MAQMQERLARYLEAMEPDALMSAWLPGGTRAWPSCRSSSGSR